MADTPNELLTGLLENVSRTFYRTLRVLPASVRPQISLAYLLARTTDTIADTELVPLASRLSSLEALRERIAGTSTARLEFGELAQRQGVPAERVLLEKCEDALALFSDLPADDRERVRNVLNIIVSGQELDLRRFGSAGPGEVAALQTDEELDDYTYRVAGCVGEFWTKMCRAHVFPRARLDDAALLAQGVRFGKGLQLVNILRDLPADLRRGRCYLPADSLSGAGLVPADLMSAANQPKLRRIYEGYLARAEAHLAAGWAYTNALPWRHARVRMACAWPILIGVSTIARLRAANVLDPERRIKISRREVRKIILRSILSYPCPPAWRKLAPL